jgi:hypothetical protein
MRLKLFFKIDGKEKGCHEYVVKDKEQVEDLSVWLCEYFKRTMEERKDLNVTVEATTKTDYIT